MINTPDDVVVTGLGAVTPLGVGAQTLIQRWLAGESHIVDGFGHCDDFDPLAHLSRRDVRITDRFTQMALVAAEEALTQARWPDGVPYSPDRIGSIIASGVGGILTLESGMAAFRNGSNLPPHGLTAFMINAAAASLAIRHGWRGECHAVVAACASGVQAIGSAVRLLHCDEADAVVVGATDTRLTSFGKTSFELIGVLSASGRCRPWDRRRDGFTPGEGAGVMVLERRSAAKSRGVAPIAEIRAVAATNDAHHLSLPPTEGDGLARAIRTAIDRSGLRPADVDYVNPHGASSPIGDVVETVALKGAFGAQIDGLPVSSTKSAIGHLIGAAGAVETIATILALQHAQAPPTLGLDDPDDGLDLWYVPGRSAPIEDRSGKGFLAGLSFSFGLGGHNAAAVVTVPGDQNGSRAA